MGLLDVFDVFSFKKEAEKVFNKENFKEILEKAKETIIQLAKEKMPGKEKKDLLDKYLTNIIYVKIENAKIKNKLVLWLIDKLIEILPTVTQLVYDFLKEKVESL